MAVVCLGSLDTPVSAEIDRNLKYLVSRPHRVLTMTDLVLHAVLHDCRKSWSTTVGLFTKLSRPRWKSFPRHFRINNTVETWVTVEIRRRWDIGSMTLKKSTEISDFCKRLRVTDLNIFQSIFVVWGQMRTLWAPPGHSASNALQTRRYWGL